MKYIKTFENFENFFIEITFFLYDNEVMVDIKNNNIDDIYTSQDNNINFINWEKGDNKLFVHCNPNEYHIILDELLNGDDSTLYEDEENNEQYYNEILDFLNKKLEILKNTNKYNI